jgi:Urb2/Npa2 family
MINVSQSNSDIKELIYSNVTSYLIKLTTIFESCLDVQIIYNGLKLATAMVNNVSFYITQMKLKASHISILLSLVSSLEMNQSIDEAEDLFEHIYSFMYALTKAKAVKGLLPIYLNTLVRLTTSFSETQISTYTYSNLRPPTSSFKRIVRLYEHLPEHSKKHSPFMIASLVGMKVSQSIKADWRLIIMKLMDSADEHGRALVMTMDHYRPLLKTLRKEWETEFKYSGKS